MNPTGTESDLATRALPTPSPKEMPLLGNIDKLAKGNAGCLYDAILQVSHDYDEAFRLRVGNQYWHVLTSIDAMKQVMLSEADKFPKGETLTELRALGIGEDGLVEVEGQQWLRQRRLSLPAFRKGYLSNVATIVRDKTKRMLELLDEAEEFESLDAMCRLALAIICQAGFGYHNLCLDSLSSTDPVLYTNHFGSEELMKRMKFTGYWKYLPTPSNFKLKKLVEAQKAFFRKIIAEKKAAKGESNDLLDIFMQAEDEDGNKFTEKELLDQMQNFMGASFESIGTTLHWLFYFIDRHPEVERRIVAELNEVLGDEEIPTEEHLGKLHYLRMTLLETLRLRPAFPIFFRQAKEDCVVGGYKVAAKSFVLPLIGKIHTDPNYWGPTPHLFNPDHFKPGADKTRPRYAYAPFGLGPRKCIGENMGVMEAMVIAGAILKRFRLERVIDHAVVPYVKFTWMTKYGIKMRAIRRDTDEAKRLQERHLGILESSIYKMNALSAGAGNLVSTFKLSTAVSVTEINAVLPDLFKNHPLLSMVCSERGQDLVFTSGPRDRAFPTEAVKTEPNETLQACVERQYNALLNKDFVNAPWPFEISVIREEGSDNSGVNILFATTHMVSDGQTQFVIAQDLLQLINHHRQQTPVQPSPQYAVCQPLEAEMPPAHRSFGGFFRSVKAGLTVLGHQKRADKGLSFPFSAEGDVSERRSIGRQITLDQDELTALSERAKDAEANVHSALGVALLCASVETMAKTRTSEQLTMKDGRVEAPIVTTIDMRRRLDPPLSSSSSGYLSSGIMSTPNVPVSLNGDTFQEAVFWDACRKMQDDNLQALEREDAWSSVRVMELMGPKGLGKQYKKAANSVLYAPVYFANLGRLAANVDDEIALESFSLFSAFHAFGPGIFAISSTVNDRLNLTVTCPHPAMNVESLNQVTERTREILRLLSGVSAT